VLDGDLPGGGRRGGPRQVVAQLPSQVHLGVGGTGADPQLPGDPRRQRPRLERPRPVRLDDRQHPRLHHPEPTHRAHQLLRDHRSLPTVQDARVGSGQHVDRTTQGHERIPKSRRKPRKITGHDRRGSVGRHAVVVVHRAPPVRDSRPAPAYFYARF
jgi:hypothetical protein